MSKIPELQKAVFKLRGELEKDYKKKMIILGKKLKKYRNDCGMNQNDLALLLGKTRTHIVNVETGNSPISLKDMIYMCSFFEITPNDFLLDEEIKK